MRKLIIALPLLFTVLDASAKGSKVVEVTPDIDIGGQLLEIGRSLITMVDTKILMVDPGYLPDEVHFSISGEMNDCGGEQGRFKYNGDNEDGTLNELDKQTKVKAVYASLMTALVTNTTAEVAIDKNVPAQMYQHTDPNGFIIYEGWACGAKSISFKK